MVVSGVCCLLTFPDGSWFTTISANGAAMGRLNGFMKYFEVKK